MACATYNPDLPVETKDQQAAWLFAWDSILLNDSCLQRSCALDCLPGNQVNDEGCKDCLKQAGCSTSLGCANCLGSGDITFDRAYGCTFGGLSAGEIVGIVLGTLAAVILLAISVIALLYVTNKLPVKWKLWIDTKVLRKKKKDERIYAEKEEQQFDSGKGSWGGGTR